MFSKYNFDIITIIGIFLMLYVVGGISGWLYEMGFYRINFGYFILSEGDTESVPGCPSMASGPCLFWSARFWSGRSRCMFFWSARP